MDKISKVFGHKVNEGQEGASEYHTAVGGFTIDASDFGAAGTLSIGRSQFDKGEAIIRGRIFYPDGRDFPMSVSKVAPFLACSHGIPGLPSAPSVDTGSKQVRVVLDNPKESIVIFKQFSPAPKH